MNEVLSRIRPTSDEVEAMEATCKRLVAAATSAMTELGLEGEATVQGSIAKHTWLAGGADVDLFILMNPDLPEDELRESAEKIGHKILFNPLKKYAQHPYIIGEFEKLEVDLVPAYKVDSASARMSAVDRTPFHTQWVLSKSDGAMRDEIRLAKQWCKGTEVYGADTATGGFSGYLVEVLCIAKGGFGGFIDWLASDAQPRRVAIGDDQVTDHVSPLVVVDPVDPARNCGAAVALGTLEQACSAAKAYNGAAAESFFFPAPRRDEPEARTAHMQREGLQWLGLTLEPQTDRLDIVLPQFHKAGRALTDGFARVGFQPHRHRVDVIDGLVCMQWVFDAGELPATAMHRGPPAAREPNASKFTAKWQNHPDRVGEIVPVDGTLTVEVRNNARTPAQWLEVELPRFQAGKHVAAALRKRTIESEPRGSWAPIVTDFVLARRPWQR